jgi:hypothetical protein
LWIGAEREEREDERGKMGKWESGKMGKWGSGEMGKWGNGKVGKWENDIRWFCLK